MAIDYTRFPLAKRPRPKKAARTTIRRRTVRASARTRAKRAATAVVIAAVRRKVFALDAWCIVCGADADQTDEMHEVVPRSKTRGLPPEQRFSVGNCVRLCWDCHQRVTTHGIEMAPYPGGGVVYQYWPRVGVPEKAWLYRRGGVPPGDNVMVYGVVKKGIWTEARMAETKTKPAAVKAKPVTPARRKPAGR